MDRRRLLAGLLALPAPSFVVTDTCLSMPPRLEPHSDDPNESGSRTAIIPLIQSGPVTSHADGQVIEKLDVEAMFGNGVTVMHRGVTVRNCRIRYAGGHGVYATEATGLVLQDLEIDHLGAPPSGVGSSQDRNGVNSRGLPEHNDHPRESIPRIEQYLRREQRGHSHEFPRTP